MPFPPADPFKLFQKIILPKRLVGAEAVIRQLRLLGEPISLVRLRTVIPAVRQIGGAELVTLNGNGGQELIVQLGGLFRFLLAHIGDVQRMAVLAEHRPVVLPAHTALVQPAAALEHTLREDDVDLLNRMLHAPQIGDGVRTAAVKIILEVHFMQHALHIWHTDLKRGMDFLSAQLLVNKAGILFGDQPLAVEAGDFDSGHRFQPVIFAGAALRSVVLHRDHLCGRGRSYRIVNDHHPVGAVNVDAVNADTAGQHQAVVSVEFTELAVTDGHIHHDAAAHRVIKILPDEGQPRLPAHAARTLKGKIAMRPGAKIKAHALGTEQSLGLLLSNQVFLSGTAPVKDAGEVHIENDVGEVRHQLPAGCSGEGIAVQHAHDLIEQCVIVLLVGCGK